MNKSRLMLLLAIATLPALYFMLDLDRYLDLAYFKSQQTAVMDYYTAHPLKTAALYFMVYVIVTAISLPGATLMTLVGGAIFGFGWGLLLVSFASTLGATLAFLGARYLLRDWVQARYGTQLKSINAGVERDGAFYLFSLRLLPIIPFFLINLLLGLTRMSARTFYGWSQLGMLAGTAVYVNAGTQLARIDSLSGLLSLELLCAFGLLALFPWIARRLVDFIKARQVYRGYSRPRRFDRNLIVIGGGSAGLVTSYIAAAVHAKVTLIEKHKMGGDCLNTGCVPSKALIRSAKYASQLRRGSEFGFRNVQGETDFAAVMSRVRQVVKAIEPHDSVERYTGLGVECIAGEARLLDPWTVAVNDQRLTARHLVIATGARPFVPSLPGLDLIKVWTSDNLWEMRELPRRLCVLGGGPIGAELAQAFSRLGSEVTQVEMLPRLLTREDPDIAERVRERFVAEGIRVCTHHKALRVELNGTQKMLICEHEGQEVCIEFDELLCAVGRVANVQGFGLEALGVRVHRTVEVDGFLRTNFPNILACGDVAGPYQFTHTAAHQAWYAAVNALFSGLKSFPADYRVIPWATFTEPEVARVGLNETEAREQGIACEVTRFAIDDLDRAIADGEAHGVVKVLTVPGKDRILGVTIVGEHAADLIAEYVLAMKQGIGLNRILGTIHIYPTLAEANKYAAGQWKKVHAPERVLRWLARYHTWRRGE